MQSVVSGEPPNEQLQQTRRAKGGPLMRRAERASVTVGRLAAELQCSADIRRNHVDAVLGPWRPRLREP